MLLLATLALAKPVIVDDQSLQAILRNRDCNAGCLNAGDLDTFGWYNPKNKKCGCGHWERPEDLMTPKLYLSFAKTYSDGKVHSSDIDREETWTAEPSTSLEPLKTVIFSPSQPVMTEWKK